MLERGAVAHRAPSADIAPGISPRSSGWSGCASPRRRDTIAGGRCPMPKPDDPARTRRLFGDRRPAAAEAAGRRAHRVLDHRQLRGLGHRQADGAATAAGADRRAADAGCGALGLPRIRHAGGLLALPRAVQEAEASSRRSPPMRASARTIRASPAQARDDGWEFMGHAYEQGPIHKEARPGRHDPSHDGHHGEIHRQAAGRLARAGTDADPGDAGPARRRRRQIYRRLGL